MGDVFVLSFYFHLQCIQLLRWICCVIIPLLAILILSTLIAWRIIQIKRTQKRLKTNQTSIQGKAIKVATNITVLVLAFIFLIIPPYVVSFIATYFPDLTQSISGSQSMDLLNKFSMVAKILNCSVNSCVFLSVSTQFRGVAYSMLGCKLRK